MPINLDQISIAKPCSANWDEMPGDERTRHCGACKLNVYNLSDMTREEAEKLIQAREGRLCVRFFKRPDGTLLTQDCPVGLARVRRRLAILSSAMAASIFLAAGTVLARAGFKDAGSGTAANAIKNWLNPLVQRRGMAMGDICVTPAAPVAPVPVPAPAVTPEPDVAPAPETK